MHVLRGILEAPNCSYHTGVAGRSSLTSLRLRAARPADSSESRPLFGLKIARDSIDAVPEEDDWGHILIRGFAMGTGHPPQNKQDRRDEFRGVEHADNVLPLREENARLRRIGSPYQESNELIRLLEENGRLRKLAIELSNLVGDLPVGSRREIEPEIVKRLSVIGRVKAS
jgi:hypothetical protein